VYETQELLILTGLDTEAVLFLARMQQALTISSASLCSFIIDLCPGSRGAMFFCKGESHSKADLKSATKRRIEDIAVTGNSLSFGHKIKRIVFGY
jgi:hypothetical protein